MCQLMPVDKGRTTLWYLPKENFNPRAMMPRSVVLLVPKKRSRTLPGHLPGERCTVLGNEGVLGVHIWSAGSAGVGGTALLWSFPVRVMSVTPASSGACPQATGVLWRMDRRHGATLPPGRQTVLLPSPLTHPCTHAGCIFYVLENGKRCKFLAEWDENTRCSKERFAIYTQAGWNPIIGAGRSAKLQIN